MPCVLVSPDSVARFFPVGSQTFDLVVFDEASQIRVADAIGAMGRAKSVVVVGDSKQMPPTTFAEQRPGPRTTTPPETSKTVEDEESILTEAVLARVPQRWLTWHYRSQDESLIAFSNAHYYESKLSSFPAPSHSTADRRASGVGVSLVRVNGTFRRTGSRQAVAHQPGRGSAIFAEIQPPVRAVTGPVPSFGVVTFNQQQRSYIEGLIRDSQDERLIEALDGKQRRGTLHQEPRERPRRRARCHPLLYGVLGERQGRAALELRPAHPGRRRATTERRDHPSPADKSSFSAPSIPPRSGSRKPSRKGSGTSGPIWSWPRMERPRWTGRRGIRLRPTVTATRSPTDSALVVWPCRRRSGSPTSE